jgi:hypothetical protein
MFPPLTVFFLSQAYDPVKPVAGLPPLGALSAVAA